MRINYKSGRSVNAGFSDKVDAEFINRAVFRINDKLNDKAVFYKCGLVFLSGCDSSLETELKKIDNLTGMIDLLLLRNDIKKALLYTTLLKKKMSEFINKVNQIEIDLPVAG